MVIGDIIKKKAKDCPQRTATVSGDMRYSFGELNERVNRLTNALVAPRDEEGRQSGNLGEKQPQAYRGIVCCGKRGDGLDSYQSEHA